MDNCSGQNKNDALYTSIVAAVHDSKLEVERLPKAGHTFKRADNCHAKVERAMKKMVNVYDFADFANCIESTKAIVKTPLPSEHIWRR